MSKISLFNIDNLIFDLDDTLYNYNSAHEKALKKTIIFIKNICNYPKKEILKAFNSSRKKTHIDLLYTGASHNRLLYFQKTFELLKLDSMAHSIDCYNIYWNTFLENMVLFDGVKELLQVLKKQNKKICILTDLTSHIQFRKIKALGIQKHIDFIVSSEECGKEKPHPIMFFKALEKLNCGKEDVIMIGDNWAKDILGAENMGIKSVWINNKKEKKQETSNIYQINEFKELKDFLC